MHRHFKPLVERRASVVSSNNMEPTKFDSMRKAAKAIWVGEGVIRMRETMVGISSKIWGWKS